MSNSDIKEPEEKMSEGEIYIQEFFQDKKIDYEYNKKLNSLKGDNKAYRLADFYIPKYDLYIEFFGQWNSSEEHKERYKEKKHVYEKNNIACIYFYPENLGIIDYLFSYRAMKELKAKGKKKQLFKFRKDLVLRRNPWRPFRIVISILFIILVLLTPNINPQYNLIIYIIGLIGILGDSSVLINEYRGLVRKTFN